MTLQVNIGMRIIDEGAMYNSYVLLIVDSVTASRVRARKYGVNHDTGAMGWQAEAKTRKLYRPRIVSHHLSDDDVLMALTSLWQQLRIDQSDLIKKYETAVSAAVADLTLQS